MPLFSRSSSSKRALSTTPSTGSTPAAPPPQLGSPFQLSLSFVPSLPHHDRPERAESYDSSLSSSQPSLTSASTAGTSVEDTGSGGGKERWSLVSDATQVSPNGGRGGAKQRERSASGGSAKLRNFFSAARRSRSGSRGGRDAQPARNGAEESVEFVPPVPALPPGLAATGLPTLDRHAEPASRGEEAYRSFSSPPATSSAGHDYSVTVMANGGGAGVGVAAEDDELASLLHLVHAAGDRFASNDDDETRLPYVPPTPVEYFRTPPLASTSTFSTPSTVGPATPPTRTTPAKPVYSFLSHLPQSSPNDKPSYSFLNSPPQKAAKSPPSSFPASHTARPPPSSRSPAATAAWRDSQGPEDDYGADSIASASSDAESEAPKPSPRPSLPAASRPNHPHTTSFSSPRRVPSPPRPLGPAASALLSHTVAVLTPSPSSSSSVLPGPLSTHPTLTVRPPSCHSTPADRPLRTTLGRLGVLRKLKRGLTLLEGMEVESCSSSVGRTRGRGQSRESDYFDKRASRISLSARVGEGEESLGVDEGEQGRSRRSLEQWEEAHGAVDEPSTLRGLLSSPSTPPLPTPAPSPSPSPSAAVHPLPLPRLSLWASRPPFVARMEESREVRGLGLVEDVVRPSRVNNGWTGRLEVSARVKGLIRAHEGGGKMSMSGSGGEEGRRKGGEGDLLIPTFTCDDGGQETLPDALRAAAAGARPPPFASVVNPSRAVGPRRGRTKPLLPGPLLLKALAEEGWDGTAPATPVEEEVENLLGEEDKDDEEEDDRPLSLLRPLRSHRSLPSSSSASRPVSTAPLPSALLHRSLARTSALEAKVSRLRRAQEEREVEVRREQEAREEEVRERGRERVRREQRRRSGVANAGVAAAGAGEERKNSGKRVSVMPSYQGVQQQQQAMFALSRGYGVPTMVLPVPVPVAQPFYHLPPQFSTSVPNLQYLSSPAPLPVLPNHEIHRSASRQSLLPPPHLPQSRPGPSPLSPQRRSPSHSPHRHSHRPDPSPTSSSSSHNHHVPSSRSQSRSQPTTPTTPRHHPSSASSSRPHPPPFPHSESMPLPQYASAPSPRKPSTTTPTKRSSSFQPLLVPFSSSPAVDGPARRVSAVPIGASNGGREGTRKSVSSTALIGEKGERGEKRVSKMGGGMFLGFEGSGGGGGEGGGRRASRLVLRR